MNPLLKLADYGQSVWLDNISRSIINNGELKKLINEDGLKGVTSNPTIFQKAIGSGADYDSFLKNVLENDPHLSPREIFESLAVRDIRDAADILMGVYESSGGKDGFVSIEVSPDYAYDTKATIEEAARLSARTGKPNVMIKIPATSQGIPAIKEMISRGVNINVTLIFSPEVYEQVADAYITGLENRLEKGERIDNIASVASFFISRIDTMADKELDKKGRSGLKGRTAVANARLVYRRAKEIFSSRRFKKLEAEGARVQRLLWASTSTKNPDYPATIYVDELIGKDTVNTMPPATIDAFRKQGNLSNAIERDLDKAEEHMKSLSELGIDFLQITEKLTTDGVELFAESFRDLLSTIDKKRNEILSKLSSDLIISLPPSVNLKYKRRLEMWENERAASRLWQRDFTLWKERKEDDKELSNRLGWLDMPYLMQNVLKDINEFADAVRKEYDNVILLGMGGSSLAPEVLFKIFGRRKDYPALKVLDSTHPESVKNVLGIGKAGRTLYIVSSKSGTTVETTSFMLAAYNEAAAVKKNAGADFVAITDPGTVLEKFALEKSFRKIFHTPPEVGGRYSALTFFGLVPAALIGIDTAILLNRAFQVMIESKEDVNIKNSGAYRLGAALGELASAGKDKLVFVTSDKISAFPDWIEQLVAESTGKEGKGIVPVIEDAVRPPEKYGKDTALVYIRFNSGDNSDKDRRVEDVKASGAAVIQINLEDEYDIGKEFFRWELAVALAGSVMRINPFDQPNVQLAKTIASDLIKEYKKRGSLSEQKELLREGSISAFSRINGSTIADLLDLFFMGIRESSYIAVMAYAVPGQEAEKELINFTKALAKAYNVSVTTGYGPRFLHSTGQLHKGGDENGFFIQLTSAVTSDLEVPGEGYTFGTLITAQAKGDFDALTNLGKKVIRFHFNQSTQEGIRYLADVVHNIKVREQAVK